MDLPNDEVGISDIIGFRECPRRMDYGMDRHTIGDHPEMSSHAAIYGTAFHDAVEYAERHDASNEQATQHAFNMHFAELEPDDLRRLQGDLQTYREREPENVRLIAAEHEFRLPLMKHEGRTIYFRGRLDRLYEYRDRPGHFLMVDYKTGALPKSRDEVDKDLQFWAYNYAIHEQWPECEDLEQVMDQLQFQPLAASRKTDADRRTIKTWLVTQVTAMLEFDERGPDGRFKPRKNRWCGSCGVMESCPIVDRMTSFARLDVLTASAPADTKAGGLADPEVRELLMEHAERLPEVTAAKTILDRYEKSVKRVLLQLSDTERERLGYVTRSRSVTTFPERALRAAHEELGDAFYRAVSLSQKAVKDSGVEPEVAERVLELGLTTQGAPFVQAKKK